MHVLVFGGTRFMGKHLVNELLSKDYDVTIATRGITPDDFGNNVTRLIVDRANADSMKNTVKDLYYDVVFDSLAYCSNDVQRLFETIKCKRYVQISSASVYSLWHNDMKEDAFDPCKKALVWCERSDFPYDEVKRQAECAIVQKYANIPSVCIRFPFVIGTDDYTMRLYFYIEHTIKQKPMFINCFDSKMAFVRSDEAGKYMAFFADNPFTGTINGASDGTISIKEVLAYVKAKTGKSPILSEDGETAPYNGAGDFYLNMRQSKALGFSFLPLSNWIYDLIDYYIAQASL